MNDSNNKILCHECGTENETDYIYCKNCGARLPVNKESEPTEPFAGYYAQNSTPYGENQVPNEPNPDFSNPQYGENNYANPPYGNRPPYTQNGFIGNSYVYGNTYVENIDGIPYGEVATFVGKKADKYMPVFSRMEITGGKTAWHWPIAVLGFLFGPLGAALWCFYRKMYKPALILAAIGAVLTIITSLLTGPALADVSTNDILDYFSGNTSALETLVDDTSVGSKVADLIDTVSSFATAIVCGLFAHGWYKKHIRNSIMNCRYRHIDPRYYQMGLASAGGTSGGMLALGIIIMLFVENIATLISAIPNLIIF